MSIYVFKFVVNAELFIFLFSFPVFFAFIIPNYTLDRLLHRKHHSFRHRVYD